MQRSAGDIIRFWRKKRSISQEALAAAINTSYRHLNYIENGKSSASRALLLRICAELELTVRARNLLLEASGHAPDHVEADLGKGEAKQALRILQSAVMATEKYPAMVIDRNLNVQLRNPAMDFIIHTFAKDPKGLLAEPLTIPRLNFHPTGLRDSIENICSVYDMHLGRIHRHVESSNVEKQSLRAFEEMKELAPDISGSKEAESPHLIIPIELERGCSKVRLVTAVGTLGETRDVTLDTYHIDYGFPADEESEAFLRNAAERGWR